MTAIQLAQILGLEKSSVSRMLSKLIEANEIKEVQAINDGRFKSLQLTDKGRNTVKKINAYGEMRVIRAIENSEPFEQKQIAQGLTSYAEALVACRTNPIVEVSKNIEIVSGYRAGMIGRIAEMHGRYYAKNYGFGHFFEAKVASGVAEFSERLHDENNNIWLAIHNDQIIGSVAIDGQDLGNNEAHLRWFILEDGYQGSGMGKRLLAEAITFCDQKEFSAVQLWTFSGLDAARKLYESFGFKLTKEWEGNQWGKTMLEQQFTR
jgi:GNAT superfamily N-acetyltransferase